MFYETNTSNIINLFEILSYLTELYIYDILLYSQFGEIRPKKPSKCTYHGGVSNEYARNGLVGRSLHLRFHCLHRRPFRSPQLVHRSDFRLHVLQVEWLANGLDHVAQSLARWFAGLAVGKQLHRSVPRVSARIDLHCSTLPGWSTGVSAQAQHQGPAWERYAQQPVFRWQLDVPSLASQVEAGRSEQQSSAGFGHSDGLKQHLISGDYRKVVLLNFKKIYI